MAVHTATDYAADLVIETGFKISIIFVPSDVRGKAKHMLLLLFGVLVILYVCR